jgi:hypothetical protein
MAITENPNRLTPVRDWEDIISREVYEKNCEVLPMSTRQNVDNWMKSIFSIPENLSRYSWTFGQIFEMATAYKGPFPLNEREFIAREIMTQSVVRLFNKHRFDLMDTRDKEGIHYVAQLFEGVSYLKVDGCQEKITQLASSGILKRYCFDEKGKTLHHLALALISDGENTEKTEPIFKRDIEDPLYAANSYLGLGKLDIQHITTFANTFTDSLDDLNNLEIKEFIIDIVFNNLYKFWQNKGKDIEKQLDQISSWTKWV